MRMDDLLTQHGVPFLNEEGHHHARSGWLQMDCPFCSSNATRYRLGYNLAGRYFNCWVCGPHRVAETFAALTGRGLAESIGLTRKVEVNFHTAMDVSYLRSRVDCPKGVGPMLRAHRQYLIGRGFNASDLERLWRLEGIGIAAKLAWRIFIPIHYRGEVVSWTTRTIGERGIRYKSARPDQEKMDHKDLLYGEDHVRGHKVIVCEGPSDVWRVGPGAVATFGVGFSPAQLRKIAQYPVRTVCFDPEPEAQNRARQLVERLSVFPGETYRVELTGGTDPGNASSLEVNELRERFLV